MKTCKDCIYYEPQTAYHGPRLTEENEERDQALADDPENWHTLVWGECYASPPVCIVEEGSLSRQIRPIVTERARACRFWKEAE